VILVELAGERGTEALVGQLEDLEDDEPARSVRGQLVADAHDMARAHDGAVPRDVPGDTGVRRLRPADMRHSLV